jgi:hypothetical protein
MERHDAEKINLLVTEIFDRVNQVLLIVNDYEDMRFRKKNPRGIRESDC